MSPLPRRAAVTSGVPSASRAQVFSGRPGSGSASTCRETVTSSGAASPTNGLGASNGATCFGVSQDSAPPSVRPPRRSARRDQIVVAGREPRAGEADQHAAAVDEIGDLVVSRPRPDVHVGERQHRGLFGEQVGDRIGGAGFRLAHVGERRERARDVVGRREQRLGEIGAAAGDDRDAPALGALVDQPRRARRGLAVDGEPA